jgi:hypothetical protein
MSVKSVFSYRTAKERLDYVYNDAVNWRTADYLAASINFAALDPVVCEENGPPLTLQQRGRGWIHGFDFWPYIEAAIYEHGRSERALAPLLHHTRTTTHANSFLNWVCVKCAHSGGVDAHFARVFRVFLAHTRLRYDQVENRLSGVRMRIEAAYFPTSDGTARSRRDVFRIMMLAFLAHDARGMLDAVIKHYRLTDMIDNGWFASANSNVHARSNDPQVLWQSRVLYECALVHWALLDAIAQGAPAAAVPQKRLAQPDDTDNNNDNDSGESVARAHTKRSRDGSDGPQSQ